jgi:capsular polysaccharide export protein
MLQPSVEAEALAPVLSEWISPPPLPAPPALAPHERHFLFVTAPFGPFSKRLARSLRTYGARCRRVILNGGDMAEWGLREAVVYRGARGTWRDWIREHLKRSGVTDLITHGDSHSYAAEAIKAARELNIAVHVFEQGYFRPHWITLERDGVNAHSRLPKSADDYRRIIVTQPLAQPAPVGRITPTAVRRIVRHQLASYALAPLFPQFRNPYAYGALRQGAAHVMRFARQKLLRRPHRRRLQALLRSPYPVFLALLQRPGDSQLTRHSRFAESRGFIEHVIFDFAANAAPTARLLFKSHPLDHGIEPHGLFIREAAAIAGVADRVFFADEGHFPSLIGRACGVVTVNSTGGLSAIEAGLPTIVLGRAIYDMEGLTHQLGLSTFWRTPQNPDGELFEKFRAVVMASCQINGAFSTEHGMRLSLAEAARRLINAQPHQ